MMTDGFSAKPNVLIYRLDMPLRGRNALLLSAGFAPVYKESDLSAPDLAEVDKALTKILDQHDPYPAVAADRLFNIIRVNEGAKKLQTWLYGVERPEDLPSIADNFVRGLFHPEGYRNCVKNWEECAYYLLRAIQLEELASRSQDLVNELLHSIDLPKGWQKRVLGSQLTPLLTINLEKDGVQLNFFLANTTFGTPLNVTLQETRIRSCFPADDETRQFFKG